MAEFADAASNSTAHLGGLLADAAFRKSFAHDPHGALKDAGVDVESLPEGLLEALAEMGHDELRALARVRDILKDHVDPGAAAEMV